MAELRDYSDPQSFLKESEPFLLENEMENNVLLGNCYNILLENRSYESCHFINVFLDRQLGVSSVQVNSKINLSGENEGAIKTLYEFYKNNKIDFKGAIGNRKASELFSRLSGKEIVQHRTTLVQDLTKTNELHLANGSFEPSRLSDLPILKKWLAKFFEDENLLPKRNEQETELFLKNLMKYGNIFSWTLNGRAVSMAAIIRKTKNTAIIGLVYTPPEFRGKGSGTSCVHQLSEYILKKGYKRSGLLVNENNNTAGKIYARIGYSTVTSLSDIDFT